MRLLLGNQQSTQSILYMVHTSTPNLSQRWGEGERAHSKDMRTSAMVTSEICASIKSLPTGSSNPMETIKTVN